MPLPFVLIGLGAVAAATGAKKAYDGYQDSSKADDITDSAERNYRNTKNNFDGVERQTNSSLNSLGELQLQIGSDFAEFQRIAKPLLEKLEQHQETKHLEVNVPKHELDRIDGVAFSTAAYLGQVAGAGIAGAGAAYAVYGGVMALAAASTGTPIAALSGAAAYNAAMAAIGGGSLAAGGLGMAGGAAILGGVVAAPIALVAGFAYANHAEKKLNNAIEYKSQVTEAVDKMTIAIKNLKSTRLYADKIHIELNRVYKIFGKYFQDLKNMDTLIRNGIDIDVISDALILIIQNGYQLAAILTDIITTPLFKTEKDRNGEVLRDENGTVIFETDENDIRVINGEEINAHLTLSEYKTKSFEA